MINDLKCGILQNSLWTGVPKSSVFLRIMRNWYARLFRNMRIRLSGNATDTTLIRSIQRRQIGQITQPELADLYRVADIDLVPSRREPFGLVAIEAMACGTPVVATNQGGLPDFVDSSVGALVEPENAEDLAIGIIKTMDRAVCNPEWRTKIADYATQNYSQAVIIAEIEELTAV